MFNFFIKISTTYDNIIIVGENVQSQELEKKINSTSQLGYKIISVINPKKEKLEELIKKYKSFTVVSSINLREHEEFVKLLYKLLPSLNLENFSDFYEKITEKIPLSQIDELWLLKNIKESSRGAYEKTKRITDVLMGGMLFLALMLIIVPAAIAIRIDSSGPIFYKQKRVGKNGKFFELIKLRSMVQDAEKKGAVWAQKDDSRITKVGKILRKTLLDELPQAINIIKGDISFFGPRPERPEFFEELEEKIPFYQIRHLIKPGLTGWAQVNYKYGNTIEDTLQKLQYDLFYLKNRSFILDIKIFLKTINVFLKGGTL